MREADDKEQGMKQQVCKYEIKGSGVVEIEMLGGSQIISFAYYKNEWCIWAVGLVNAFSQKRIFWLSFTEEPFRVYPNKLIPIGSFLSEDDCTEAHLFEIQSVVGCPAERLLQ